MVGLDDGLEEGEAEGALGDVVGLKLGDGVGLKVGSVTPGQLSMSGNSIAILTLFRQQSQLSPFTHPSARSCRNVHQTLASGPENS